MNEISFTPEQRAAIETIDRSVLVSAAAGSGKTAVLSERCAYLVCDAPPERRCDIDQLVVVTFTENAAAEMRVRIRKALQRRLARHPANARLRDQLALIDNARISTLHAFGLWILRRWFSHAEIDPAAPLLDAHEADLLRAETLERLFEQLYAEDSELAAGFRKLVDDYGLGDDQGVRRFIQQLGGFLESLPDPEGWLAHCLDLVSAGRHRLLTQLAADLAEELEGQADYCRRAADHIEHHLPDFAFYGEKLAEAFARLNEWRAQLPGTDNDDGVGRVSPAAAHVRAPDEKAGETRPTVLPGTDSNEGTGAGTATVAALGQIQAVLGAHKFRAAGAPRLAKDAPAEVHARRELARELYNHFTSRLFKGRLQRVFGRFAPEEWFAGLDRIAPYVKIVTQLVGRYRGDYARAKSDLGVLDFSDLERKTYELLVNHEDIADTLRRRFEHVLVDEFQDINPLQEAVIRLVSREPEDKRPDNLFVVGDVKQSIYRFRLAEPAIFLERQAALSDADSAGVCIHLQRNYRSDPNIIDAANHLFRRLLIRNVGGIEYDESAELRVGRMPDDTDSGARPGVELHLLQRRWSGASDTDSGFVDPSDPSEWSVIEREAYVIAGRIRRILDEGVTGLDGRPIGYGDVAVLLRAAAHTAAPMAQRLGSLGIPACADVGGEFFSALEVRDILSVLSVMDNMRQDIPLAAVLRSPVLGDALGEDELLALRLIDRDVPFHEVVCSYAASGPDCGLRERVCRILGRLERWRICARERPLSETLWRIYHEHGYLAYVGGRPNGAARRANLVALHEYARRFGTFQKQGLHRFLRFIESLEEQGQDLEVSPTPAAENVVRVMSIHRSKGLEFPVVVLADLGRRFNLTDAAGRLIFDRRLGLGVRVVDRERMIEYPSLPHHQVAGCVNRHIRAEELRILYVALTRAMRRLILVGSADLPALRRDYALHLGSAGPLSGLTVGMAATPLDWLVPALATMPAGAVRWHTQADRDPCDKDSRMSRPEGPKTAGVLFPVHTYEEDEMSGWTLEVSASSSEKSARRAAADLSALPAGEPTGACEGEAASILSRLTYVYPHLAVSSVPAVVAATEMRKRYDWLGDPDERLIPEKVYKKALPSRVRKEAVQFRSQDPLPRGRGSVPGTTSAAETGLITHRFLQHLDLETPPEPDALRREMQRLVAAGILTPSADEVVDIETVAWFLGTELGSRIRESRASFRREVMFVHRRPASTIDPLVAGLETRAQDGEPEAGDTVLVRGVIDGVLPGDTGVEILDYKTDRIAPAEVSERARAYVPQLSAYAAAAEALFAKPVEHRWLVFLHARTIIDAGN